MPLEHRPLIADDRLYALWGQEFETFRGSPAELVLQERLEHWKSKVEQKETTAEGAFVDVFFKQTWSYRASGQGQAAEGHSLEPRFAIEGAGQQGGTGLADLALGRFGRPGIPPIAQVLCEFKDVRSGLDAPQRRKGNDRSPVEQCGDYLNRAWGNLKGREAVLPSWAIVSDMNEFRLYWRPNMPHQYQRFILKPGPGDRSVALLDSGDAGAFQRFVFSKLFRPEMLLSASGSSPLERLLRSAPLEERKLERAFYREYQSFRETVFQELVAANPRFPGTRGRLVRASQTLLDRCLFVLFCEDMGRALEFPPNLLTDLLRDRSQDPDYDPGDDFVWDRIRKLFAAMNEGTAFREHRINRFNGGLFATDEELDALHVPSRVFCVQGQGANEETISAAPRTLLYLAARYNYGAQGAPRKPSLNLYTLGRIFEQSITDLEYMEAKAEERPSLAELSKRKRDGVYYTPEEITSYIVEQTVGERLVELRGEHGVGSVPPFAEAELAKYRAAATSKRAKGITQYLKALNAYEAALATVTVLDPACGSGAFLIQSLDRLVAEHQFIETQRAGIYGKAPLFDLDGVTRGVLTQNLYGVDINPESVEITKLALWLHSAQPKKTLCDLDGNIRCGNSLVGPEFYRSRQLALFTARDRERINAFDWKKAFPRVFACGGFDCVVGNPPYVKLQNFKKVHPDVAEWLVEGRTRSGQPVYESTQTGNFDLYLPFIEHGCELLRDGGRLGYIAPSVWTVNEYGEGLRKRLHRTRWLRRWIDFKSHQIFAEATTYTALQFFRKQSNDAIAYAAAPAGSLDELDWGNGEGGIAYTSLPESAVWTFMTVPERRLVARLATSCARLDSRCAVIFQGLITSADDVFHLDRVRAGLYRSRLGAGDDALVPIEDELMRPLVSGEEAKRYQRPVTQTYVLFPYDLSAGQPRLFTADELARRFKKGWAYLRRHEPLLRAREDGRHDDDTWYRFGRNQNLDKQESAKLVVAQTVPEMRVCFDETGAVFLNNVRVNGILTSGEQDPWFLLGVMNGPVFDWVFRRVAKPKEGGYFEANKQFIAPLPVPAANDEDRREVGERARALQQLHSKLRDVLVDIDVRLDGPQTSDDEREETWLFGEEASLELWKQQAAAGMRNGERTAWAKSRREEALAVRFDSIDRVLRPGTTLTAEERQGELRLLCDGDVAIGDVYVGPEDSAFVLAQWRRVARQTRMTESVDARKLVRKLRALRASTNATVRAQVTQLDRDAAVLENDVDRAEAEMNEVLFRLYGLTPAERELVARS